jgi:hypothetical protein
LIQRTHPDDVGIDHVLAEAKAPASRNCFIVPETAGVFAMKIKVCH